MKGFFNIKKQRLQKLMERIISIEMEVEEIK